MRVTILGCGASRGVPIVGCDCVVCKSDNPRNKRMRVSVFIENNNHNLLIDSSPDLRMQALINNIRKVDAVIYTHSHADHCHGLDDLREYNVMTKKALNVYGDKKTMEEIERRFPYAFLPFDPDRPWLKVSLKSNIIEEWRPFKVGNAEIIPFIQGHGKSYSLGYRINKFAYSTDVNFLSEEAIEILKGIDVWIVDCQQYIKAPTHAHLDLTLEWINIVKPKLAILTHMHHVMEYVKLKSELPDGVEPAYDGMKIDIDNCLICQ